MVQGLQRTGQLDAIYISGSRAYLNRCHSSAEFKMEKQRCASHWQPYYFRWAKRLAPCRRVGQALYLPLRCHIEVRCLVCNSRNEASRREGIRRLCRNATLTDRHFLYGERRYSARCVWNFCLFGFPLAAVSFTRCSGSCRRSSRQWPPFRFGLLSSHWRLHSSSLEEDGELLGTPRSAWPLWWLVG